MAIQFINKSANGDALIMYDHRDDIIWRLPIRKLKAAGFVNEYAKCSICHKIESGGDFSPSLTAKDLLRFSNILIT